MSTERRFKDIEERLSTIEEELLLTNDLDRLFKEVKERLSVEPQTAMESYNTRYLTVKFLQRLKERVTYKEMEKMTDIYFTSLEKYVNGKLFPRIKTCRNIVSNIEKYLLVEEFWSDM